MSDSWRRFEGWTLNDRYQLVSFIGSGAMGGVFRAIDPQLGPRAVAVKLINTAQLPPLVADRIRGRFAREAKAAGRIRSPHVVAVHDFGSDGALDFLVMELLEGANLKEWLAQNPSPPLALRMELIRQAAVGLAAGHAAGIVHRDVKPSNLFVTPLPEGGLRVTLVDFGIAKSVNARSEEGTFTTEGEFVGTPQYASPEQLRGEVNLTPSSDVFSLGILAYVLVTRVHPFTDEDRTRLFNGSPVHVHSPQRHTPELPDALCDLILRALRPSAADRPRTAGAFADELGAIIRSSTLTATAPSLGDVFADRTVEWPAQTPAPPQQSAGWLQHIPPPGQWLSVLPKPARRGLAAALVLGAGLLGGTTIFRPDTTDPGGTVTPPVVTDPVQTRLDARAANKAGLDFVQRREMASAAREFQRAVDLHPDHQEYLDNLGFALRESGQLRESVELLEEVVTRFPGRVTAHFNLAQSYLATGDTARAIAHLWHYIPLADSTSAERARIKIGLLERR
jgi:hypothetical protein